MSADTVGLMIAVVLASAVEFVEALTIVLAMGVARGWRSTLVGVGAALVALAVATTIVGIALVDTLPEALLKLVVGSLLLVFGLQWLRKAILRASGHKALHDEDEVFRAEQQAAREAGDDRRLGLDWFAFVVAFKGIFLEGLEIVFIVLTFGLNAGNVAGAAIAAAGTGVVVLAIGIAIHRPLSQIPENTLKFAVGLLLATFGTYWALEGLGVFAEDSESLAWPGGDAALLVLLACWCAFSVLTVRALRRVPTKVAE